MNKEIRTGTERPSGRSADETGAVSRFCRAAAIDVALVASIGVLIVSTLADAAQPVLRIESLGSNQFNIVVTNGAATHYTLWWKPVLIDEDYPWILLRGGEAGETNFEVNGGDWPGGFFRVMVAHDLDGDSWPAWQDANDHNAGVGMLSVTIDSPLHGAVVQ
jgi:hypothetical protein